MHDDENLILPAAKRVPWNKGKLIGPRPALRQNATTRLAARGTRPVASNGMRLDYERQIGCLFLWINCRHSGEVWQNSVMPRART